MRWLLTPSIGSCSGDCIAYLTISRIGHCRFKTCVGDMTAGWEGGAAATFCLSLLKLASSIHDASADAKELFPLYLLD